MLGTIRSHIQLFQLTSSLEIRHIGIDTGSTAPGSIVHGLKEFTILVTGSGVKNKIKLIEHCIKFGNNLLSQGKVTIACLIGKTGFEGGFFERNQGSVIDACEDLNISL